MDAVSPNAKIVGFQSQRTAAYGPGGSRAAELDQRVEDARALADAVDALAQTAPRASAKFGLTDGQRAGGYGLLGAFTIYWSSAPNALSAAAIGVAALIFCTLIIVRIYAAAYWIWSAIRDKSAKREEERPVDAPVYTLLAPLYREANIVADLAASLNAIDYPQDKLQILFLIESDDLATLSAARALPDAGNITILPIPRAGPRTKPKALNYGLAFARGDYVAVFDAEDRPDPDQLNAALAAFRAGSDKLAVVQAPLYVHNGDQSWIARQFEVEYAVHFGAWLPALARLGWPLPLGGTSNHFRTDALRDAGGWDPFNVTEDADLGMRLATAGYRAAMIKPPTYEEAPVGLSQWTDQRSRWIKGHVQTWLVMMRAPIAAAAGMGVARFAGVQIAFAAGLLSTFFHAPLALMGVLGALTPWVVFDARHGALLAAGYLAAALCAVLVSPLKGRMLAIITMPLYWPLQSYAALRALSEIKSQPHLWRKTPHGLTPAAPDAKSR